MAVGKAGKVCVCGLEGEAGGGGCQEGAVRRPAAVLLGRGHQRTKLVPRVKLAQGKVARI